MIANLHLHGMGVQEWSQFPKVETTEEDIALKVVLPFIYICLQ